MPQCGCRHPTDTLSNLVSIVGLKNPVMNRSRLSELENFIGLFLMPNVATKPSAMQQQVVELFAKKLRDALQVSDYLALSELRGFW